MTTTNFIYALLAGLLPSFIWLYFWTREDILHPEPRTILAATFLGGALAVVAAIFVEKWVGENVGQDWMRSIIENNLGATVEQVKYILWATAEEVLKFTAVALIALHTRSNDEPIDAMIYCITVALGFAALENVLFVMGPLSGGHISTGILTGSMRFIGATLVHTVSSALVGFMLGLTFHLGRGYKIAAALVGLALGSGLHAAFNLSIINSTAGEALGVFAWIWGAVVILIILFEEVKAVKPLRAKEQRTFHI